MLRKVILGSAVAILTTGVAVANTAPYVGAGIGINTVTTNVKVDSENLALGNFRGVPFNVFAGYGGVISQNYYLAGEAFGTITNANLSADASLKTTWSYGAAIVPGLMLSDHTLAYVRAGILRTRFSKADETRDGAQLGLGMQTSLTQAIDLRGEYDFVAYRKVNETIDGVNLRVTPRADQFNLSLVYKFE